MLAAADALPAAVVDTLPAVAGGTLLCGPVAAALLADKLHLDFRCCYSAWS